MKILMVSSEAVPFAKTGGLADAVSALSVALTNMGHEVKIVIPRYYKIDRKTLTPLAGAMGVGVGGGEAWTEVYKTTMPGCPKCEVFFIEHENSFGRDGIYGVPGETDFHDNPYRFSILCHGAFQLCRKINWKPDIIHAHDWSAALALALLKHVYRWQDFGNTAGVLSIHNLGYQGQYSKDSFPALGIDWGLYYGAGFERNGAINFLQAGISCADMITTVSPTYAREIQTPEGGFGMDGLLRVRSDVVRGILNGCDLKAWNPAVDKKIPATYSVKNMKGKAVCKAELQKQFGLPVNPNVPIFGIVTRLVDQKGIAELFAPTYGYIGYNDALSHLIEAGSDFFVMPSHYEPCGLNQIYSLIYGTLPIVRNTGGLADTVQNYNEQTGEGTGFMFDQITPSALYNTIGWAVYAYYNKKDHIKKMQERGMKSVFSWEDSAKKYLEVYDEALARK